MFIEDCKKCLCKVCKDTKCSKEICFLHKRNQSSIVQAAFPMENCTDYVDSNIKWLKKYLCQLFKREQYSEFDEVNDKE